MREREREGEDRDGGRREREVMENECAKEFVCTSAT